MTFDFLYPMIFCLATFPALPTVCGCSQRLDRGQFDGSRKCDTWYAQLQRWFESPFFFFSLFDRLAAPVFSAFLDGNSSSRTLLRVFSARWRREYVRRSGRKPLRRHCKNVLGAEQCWQLQLSLLRRQLLRRHLHIKGCLIVVSARSNYTEPCAFDEHMLWLKFDGRNVPLYPVRKISVYRLLLLTAAL